MGIDSASTEQPALEVSNPVIIDENILKEIADLTFSRLTGNGTTTIPIPYLNKRGGSFYNIYKKILNLIYKII
jgi:hypothetical protein